MKFQRILSFVALWCSSLTILAQAPEITELVYYFDADPGDGNRTAITISANDTIDVTANISTAGLSEGFHTLSVLAKDENNVWGLVERKPFYVNQSVTAVQNNLTAMEYFIDADPSQGSATAVTISTATDLDIMQSIPTTGLTEGFHVISFRAQDENGIWGLVEVKPFYIAQSISASQNTIDLMEYFIDSDPGQGNGTSIAITADTDFDIMAGIPTTGLTQGFHLLTVRARDDKGIWGHVESKTFYVNLSITSEQNILQNIEYFIDVDPGHGNGTPVTFTENTNLNFLTSIPTTGLSPGFHVLTFRGQDENGVWGLVESKPFFISLSTSEEPNLLTNLEYFFDQDPGHGNGVGIDIGDTVAINYLDSLSTAGLAPGFHRISVRGQDERGVWGLVEQKPFYLDPARNITLIEYSLGTDPGIGSGNQIIIDPAERNPEITLTLPSDGFAVGSYQFYARALDSNMQWSLTDSITVTFCDGALASFDIGSACIGAETEFMDLTINSDPEDVYTWDFDSDSVADDTSVGDVTFTYENDSTYVATLMVDRNGCVSSYSQNIIVRDLPDIIANVDFAEICIGDEIILTGSGGDTYVWDNTASNNKAFAPSETTLFTVVGTDIHGCTNTDSIEVVVKSVDQPTVELEDDDGRHVELIASSADSYQWYESETILEGETNQSISVERNYFLEGAYSVEVFEDGCSNISEQFAIAILKVLENSNSELAIWPNPVAEYLEVQFDEFPGETIGYSIANSQGQRIQQGTLDRGSNISVGGIDSGIYFLLLNQENRVLVKKFIKK